MPSPRRLIFAAALVIAAVALVWWVNASATELTVAPSSSSSSIDNSELRGETARRSPHRRSWSGGGSQFPEGVIALTWDDGPDRQTLALAQYLYDAHVTATFFVVGEWIGGLSNEPGVGAHRFEGGYRKMPTVLGEIAALGHRLGAHTENHTLLTELAAADAEKQLTDCQRVLDPLVRNELRMFRAPGGAWDRELAQGIGRSEFLAGMIGPIHWDVDAKDWDRSLYCRDAPAAECEPGPVAGERRVGAAVMAKRYVDEVVSAKRGIVLLHDRVGAVGTSYALDVARWLIPELVRRDFVFAAPVLSFSELRPRPYANVYREGFVSAGVLVHGDLNGDGRSDTCAIDAAKREARCALVGARGAKEATVWASLPSDVASATLIDINHDDRADLCVIVRGQNDVVCGLAP